jgi:simple sugar transport system permease protein
VSVVEALFSTMMLAQTLRMAVPYAYAALGGVWSERSGVVNIALEGTLLVGGLASIAVHIATKSAWAGVLAGALAGAVFSHIHAHLVERRVDAIVSGIALNLAAAGGTRFMLRALYDSSSNSPVVQGFRLRALDGASDLLLLARTLIDPLTILAVFATAATTWSLFRSRFGLRVRAAGEDPEAAANVGVAVERVRILAVTLGGAICGLGGVALAFDQHQFQSGMSGGRGFIALAAVILSGWRPVRAVFACLVFAALDALQIVLQDQARLPHEVVEMFPYVATLMALVVIGLRLGRRGAVAGRPPEGLGKHAQA